MALLNADISWPNHPKIIGKIVQPGETEGHFYSLEATVRKKWYSIPPRMTVDKSQVSKYIWVGCLKNLSLKNRMLTSLSHVSTQQICQICYKLQRYSTTSADGVGSKPMAKWSWQLPGDAKLLRSQRLPDVTFVWPGSNPSKDAQRKGAKLRVCLFFGWGSWHVDILEGADLMVYTVYCWYNSWDVFFQFFRSRK